MEHGQHYGYETLTTPLTFLQPGPWTEPQVCPAEWLQEEGVVKAGGFDLTYDVRRTLCGTKKDLWIDSMVIDILMQGFINEAAAKTGIKAQASGNP